ncbi:MAG: divalent-cation tolerance protein CutA [Novosphingobium sp.]|nr:divalent-cation tolerance protein CutA [Novosphingobium sp.]
MNSPAPALIWCPFPDREVAAATAKTLLDEGHVACANIIAEVFSLFVWNGARDECTEAAVLFKTNSALLEAAIARLAELHPYAEPAILGWRCDAAAPATARWLSDLGQ